MLEFDQLSIEENNPITIRGGILGFEELSRYTIVADEPDAPLYWLQSLDDPELAFIVVDPFLIKADYDPRFNPADLAALEIDDIREDAILLAIITLKEDYLQSTANLMAPVVINKKTLIAKQIILDDRSQPIRYNIISTAASGV